MGRIGYANLNRTPMVDYDDAEEFLALQLQNMYLADRGSQRSTSPTSGPG